LHCAVAEAFREPKVEKGFFFVAGDFCGSPTGFDFAGEEALDVVERVVGVENVLGRRVLNS
jgi:hypothetical protein